MNVRDSLLLLIPAFVIVLISFPVGCEVRASYNPLYNKGVVALFVFSKKIFYYLVSFHGKTIMLENEKETKFQEINLQGEDFEVLKVFGGEIKDKIKLSKFYVFYNIGTGDAFSSAMLCGVINQICTHLFLFLKSKKPTASFCVYDTISFNGEVFEIVFRIKISISLLDVLYSLVYAFFKKKCII